MAISKSNTVRVRMGNDEQPPHEEQQAARSDAQIDRSASQRLTQWVRHKRALLFLYKFRAQRYHDAKLYSARNRACKMHDDLVLSVFKSNDTANKA